VESALTAAPAVADSLETIACEARACAACRLAPTRHSVVVGEGSPKARLVFVGEGPGEQEDLQGRPFVGKAGQLLTKMIEAMGLKREDVYICNVVKCRPPGNRNPEPDEVAACSPYLHRQLAALQPEVIVALGKFAAQTLLKTDGGIMRIRGQWAEYAGANGPVTVMPTFHPSYLLRNPDAKREVWEDLKTVALKLGLQIPARGSS
jgi:DNA polymerase